MFRVRRYRVFLIFAIISLGLLYHFTTLGDIESAGVAGVEELKNFGKKASEKAENAADEVQSVWRPAVQKTSQPTIQDAVATTPAIPIKDAVTTTKPSVAKDTSESGAKKPSVTPLDSEEPEEIQNVKLDESPPPTTAPKDQPEPPQHISDNVIGGGQGRMDVIAAEDAPKIHWSKQPEHFPVPTESIIQLPTAKPKAIPKIQHTFGDESSDAKVEREQKLETIKKLFQFSWDGYKKNAWMKDELSPVSGASRSPFCGWAATLVDSLDTLWIMDLKEEFEKATEAVETIDFTTSIRNDIPLFETVIRYLGGLVAAYDISGGNYRILLDKAVELAEVLMGAFDTPNRMPITYYLWKP